MSQKTYQQIETKVLTDLELLDETLVGTGAGSEMMSYCNEAIHAAESIILNLCQDYFLAPPANLALTEGTYNYALPSGIYAHKIRRVVYKNGSTIYPIRRLRSRFKFEDVALVELYSTDQEYVYDILNDASSGMILRLEPASRETSSTNVKIWYIREANTVTAVSDSVDIPEFHAFIERYMKVECLRKEGHPSLPDAQEALAREQALMVTTLQNRFPDEDDALEMDMTHYQEHR